MGFGARGGFPSPGRDTGIAPEFDPELDNPQVEVEVGPGEAPQLDTPKVAVSVA